MHFLTTAAFATAAVATPWGPPGGFPSGGFGFGRPRPHGPPGFPGPFGGPVNKPTAYFLDDSADGASVVAMSIDADGKLCEPVKTSTGGKGAYAVSAAGVANKVDPLASQGSIVVGDGLVFTINTGDNTAVVFRINPEDPTRLYQLGSPVSTEGEFPVSITYSSALKTACVLNGGKVAGVTCYEVDEWEGLKPAGGLRPLGKALNQTTPPTTPPLSASEILFTPDSGAVLALTKGSPKNPSWVVAYRVEPDGSISTTPVYSALETVPVLFGSQFLPDGQTIFSSDAALGAAFLKLQKNLTVTVEANVAVEGQVAICWTAFDEELDTGYLPDAGRNVISKINPTTFAVEGTFNVTTSNATAAGPGLLDSIVYNNKLYSLAVEPGFVVVDLESEKQIQFLDLSSYGSRQGWTGLALYA